MLPPVSGPIASMPAVSVMPIASPPIFGPCLSTAVPITASIRKKVAMASSANACSVDTSRETICRVPRAASQSEAGKSACSSSAAMIAPANCPVM